MKINKLLAVAGMALLCGAGIAASAQTPQGFQGRPSVADSSDTYTPPISDYFVPASSEVVCPDSEGFIRRWSLLEPIEKDI